MDVPVYVYEANGVQVWTQAIMLSAAEDANVEVVFHYTSLETFHDVTTSPFLTQATWASLEHAGLQSGRTGPGLYASPSEPAQLHVQGQRGLGFPGLPRGAQLSAYCLPLIVCSDAVVDATSRFSSGGMPPDSEGVVAASALLRGMRVPLVLAVSFTSKDVIIHRATMNVERRFRDILQACEQDVGPDHKDTLDTVSYLAYLLDARGSSAEAEPLYRRVLDGYRRHFGHNHPSTLRSMNNLAALLQAKGKLDEAGPLLRAALAGSEHALGPDSGDTATSVNNLAYLLTAQGHFAEAEALFGRSLEYREATYGRLHLETIGCVHTLATVLENQGKQQSAEALYRRVIRDLEAAQSQCGDVSTSINPLMLSTLGRLVGLLQAQACLSEAEPLALRLLQHIEVAYGADHPEAVEVAWHLSLIQKGIGNHTGAEACCRRVLAFREAALGSESSEVLAARRQLAAILEAQDKFDAAEVILQRCLTSCSTDAVRNLAQFAEIMDSLTRVLTKRCNYGSAETVCRLLLTSCEDQYGSSHPETLATMHRLALLLDLQDKLPQAEQLYRRCLDGREAVLGASHPDTTETLNSLACLLHSAGKLTEADPIFFRIVSYRLRMQEQPSLASEARPRRGLSDASDLDSPHSEGVDKFVVVDCSQSTSPKAMPADGTPESEVASTCVQECSVSDTGDTVHEKGLWIVQSDGFLNQDKCSKVASMTGIGMDDRFGRDFGEALQVRIGCLSSPDTSADHELSEDAGDAPPFAAERSTEAPIVALGAPCSDAPLAPAAAEREVLAAPLRLTRNRGHHWVAACGCWQGIALLWRFRGGEFPGQVLPPEVLRPAVVAMVDAVPPATATVLDVEPPAGFAVEGDGASRDAPESGGPQDRVEDLNGLVVVAYGLVMVEV